MEQGGGTEGRSAVIGVRGGLLRMQGKYAQTTTDNAGEAVSQVHSTKKERLVGELFGTQLVHPQSIPISNLEL